MIKVGVSTQYKDQLFIHQLGTTFNIRLIQLDLGISSQSSSFKKSIRNPYCVLADGFSVFPIENGATYYIYGAKLPCPFPALLF